MWLHWSICHRPSARLMPLVIMGTNWGPLLTPLVPHCCHTRVFPGGGPQFDTYDAERRQHLGRLDRCRNHRRHTTVVDQYVYSSGRAFPLCHRGYAPTSLPRKRRLVVLRKKNWCFNSWLFKLRCQFYRIWSCQLCDKVHKRRLVVLRKKTGVKPVDLQITLSILWNLIVPAIWKGTETPASSFT